VHTEPTQIKNFFGGEFVEPIGFLVIPSARRAEAERRREVACQAVALCEGLEESLDLSGYSFL
jgi:hypothetical protein